MALNEPNAGQTSPSPAAPNPSPSPRILLADSDLAMAHFTGSLLQRHGFNVVAVHDGVEAMNRWAADKPDLVLLEINLAGRSGFEVCEDIRRQSSTPVIMVTTRDDKDDVLRGFQAGADDYIIKPFSPRELVMRVAFILRKRT